MSSGTSEKRRTVRIWAASDLHGIDPASASIDPQPDGCDVAVLAGDICPLPDFTIRAIQEQVIWLNVVVGEWAAAHPDIQFVAIPGNHDVFLTRMNLARESMRLPPNVHFLIDEEVEVCGLKFYGTPWCPWINGKWAFEACDPRREQMWFACIPNGTDVLVSHSPPYVEGLEIDCSCQYPTERRKHFGSRPLYDAIERRRPALNIFGHIHTGDHRPLRMPCGTLARNVSILDEDYRVAYNPAIIELTPNEAEGD